MVKLLILNRRLPSTIKGIIRLSLLAVALLMGLPSLGMAAGSGSDYGHGMMMNGWGWAGMIIGPIMMIAMLATVVVVVVLILRWLGGGSPSASMETRHPEKAALDILRERFAKGEIDKDEFEERRRILDD